MILPTASPLPHRRRRRHAGAVEYSDEAESFNELAFAGDYVKEPLTGFSATNEKSRKELAAG